MYEVYSPTGYIVHYMIHDGAVTRCGGFSGEQLTDTQPQGTQQVTVCSVCAADEAQERAKSAGR